MSESSKGGSLGVSISAHAPITVEGCLYAGKGKENDTSVSYKESTIQARNELTSHSGKDTNLIGSTLSGGKVTMSIGGNMNITSQQASHHELVKQNWGGPLFKYFTKAGGAIGVPLTLSDMMDELTCYKLFGGKGLVTDIKKGEKAK